ncbi:helix-turn-helix transcriptional regulator [Celeribacter sp. ULVN23_4]
MTERATLPAIDTSALCAETIAVAYLDVDLEGRILSCDPMAQRFLDIYPQYCQEGEADRFHIDPSTDFDKALWTASRQVAPASTVLVPPNQASNRLVQINVLPFQRQRVRVVVFWENPDFMSGIERVPALTARERAVLRLAAAGLRRDRIGHQLNISLPTVDLHCRNLRRKLSALTMSEAVAIAAKFNLLGR